MESDLQSAIQSLFPPPPDPQASAWKVGLIPLLIVMLPMAIAWWPRRKDAPATKGTSRGGKRAKGGSGANAAPVWLAPLVLGGAVFAAWVAMQGFPKSLLPTQVGARAWVAVVIASGFGFLDAWLPQRWVATAIPRTAGASVVAALFLEPLLAAKTSPGVMWGVIGSVGLLGALTASAADRALRDAPGPGGPLAFIVPGVLASLTVFHSGFSATAEAAGALASIAVGSMLVGLLIRAMRLDRGGATTLAMVYFALGVLLAAMGQYNSAWAGYVVGALVALTPASLALASLPAFSGWPVLGRGAVRILAPIATALAAMVIAWANVGRSTLY